MRSIRTICGWVTFALLGCALFSVPAYTQTKKIVFLAGPVDHGGRGRHENERDLRVLAYALEHATNLKGVTTQVYADSKAPADLNALKDAAVIVVESSSDQRAKENHALFPNNTTTDGKTYDAATLEYLKGLDGLMKKGVGLVVFHYANQIANETARQYSLDWLGGYWKEGVSTNPMDEWSMTIATPGHPILRGVNPWTYREEIFCRFFLPENPGLTPLLIGTPAKNATVGPQVASFAYQRKEGGRGFVMGGLDFNSNMLIEDNRRFLLNGIVWAAGMEVPAGGVASSSIPADMVVVSPPRPARPPQ
jgi:type 1 glutamine amidotransferase